MLAAVKKGNKMTEGQNENEDETVETKSSGSDKRSRTAIPGASRGTFFRVNPEQLKVVGKDTKHKSKAEHYLWDPRVNTIERPMVDNIKKRGVMQPIEVVKDGDDYLVVDGRRRTIHARIARKEMLADGAPELTVPVLIVRGSEDDLVGRMFSSNELRKDNSFREKAEIAMYLHQALGWTKKDIAIDMGCTTVAVDNYLAVSDLAKPVVQAMDEGKIKSSAAVKLASLSREEQAEQLKEMLTSGDTTTATAARRSRNVKAAKKAKKKGVKAKGDDEGGFQPPGKREAKHVLKQCMEDGELMSTDFVDCLRWMLGDKSPRSIGGLSALLKK